MVNTLVVGAHPDDVEIGCGGSIARHLESGDKVYVLVLTNGEKGGHSTTMQECLDSLNKLGIERSNILFGNFADGYVPDNHNIVDFIERHIRNLNIQRVYTNDPNDNHQDHRNCSKAVSSAARRVKTILLYQEPSTNALFQPHYFIELEGEHLNKKIDALSSYKSQLKKGGFDLEWIKSLARVNGMKCSARYAEAFAINHIFEGSEK